MKSTVVGVGIVGSSIVEHMKHLGHEVTSVDLGSKPTFDEAVKESDVTFIAVRPIREAGALLEQAAQIMKPGSLLVDCTSVQTPRGIDVDLDGITRKGVTICHFHFHFRPEKPLRSTLRGQHITLSIAGVDADRWKAWLIDSFAPSLSFIHELGPDEHDQVTTVSQLLHMIVAFLVSSIWQEVPGNILSTGQKIGGPPARFLTRLVLRTASGPGVVAEILECHPRTMELIAKIRRALDKLEKMVGLGKTDLIEQTVAAARDSVQNTELTAWDKRTGQLIRLEADLQSSTVEIEFSNVMNQTGLLARVLGEFDQRGIDKTTTVAQTHADHSCTFTIGVSEDSNSPAVLEAVEAIRAWAK